MSSRLKSLFKFFVDVEKNERLKVLFLSISFFFIIGGYTIAKELKDSIFVSIVGQEYYGWAKILSTFVLIPLILFYSHLVDILRRHHLLYFYSFLYGVGGLIFTYLLGHPTIGLNNLDSSPYRVFGWLFYFFIEGYSPFIVSVFWAFTNSITDPQAAKNNYTIMVAGSKLGGMCMSGFAWWLLKNKMHLMSAAVSQQVLLGLSSLFLLAVPIVIYLLMKLVSGRYLHGYEAAYKAEKTRAEHVTEDSKSLFENLKSMMSGLIMLIKYPYVMGIFGVIFFWEVVNVVLGALRLGVGKEATSSVAELSAFLFQSAFFVHLAGFFIVLFGTRGVIRMLGERRSLILVPILTGTIIFTYLQFPSAATVIWVYVIVRVINYAFASPLRESLYIPTTKDMKFKSKSWIDAFGAKVAKGCGGYYTLFANGLSESVVQSAHMLFFSVIMGLWIMTAHLLGRRFEKAVEKNEVIGLDT